MRSSPLTPNAPATRPTRINLLSVIPADRQGEPGPRSRCTGPGSRIAARAASGMTAAGSLLFGNGFGSGFLGRRFFSRGFGRGLFGGGFSSRGFFGGGFGSRRFLGSGFGSRSFFS